VRIARSVPPRRFAFAAATLAITLFASLLVGGIAPAATTCTSPPAVYPETSLTPGTTATGLTTISGTTPTSFTVEILGVIPDGIMLGIDAILGRVTGPADVLDRTGGGFSGMSGSPVSIDGLLVGVVSYGYWADPTIVVLTPGAAMVDLFRYLDAGAERPARTIAFTPQALRAVASALDVPASEITGGLEPLPVPLGVSGLSGRRLEQFQSMLQRQQLNVRVFPSGSVGAPTMASSAPFVPGQPIGAALAYGDATIWAMGIASITCGDAVAAFGHSPFYYPVGAVTIGMTGATVLTVMHTPGYPGEVLPDITDTRGTFTQDRFAGQVGIFGALPPTAAITSTFSSPDTGLSRTGRTDVAFQRDYWFTDAAWGHLFLNLGAVFQRFGDGTSSLAWTIRGTDEDGTPFTVANRGMFWSNYDAAVTVNKVTSALYALSFNRFAKITFTGVNVTGTITGARLEGTISRIRTSTSLQPKLRSRDVVKVRPGGKVTVEVTLAPVGSGPKQVSTFTVRVPGLARGLQRVDLRGGRDRPYVSDRGAGSFGELVQILSGGEHRNDLIVSGPFGRSSFEQELMVTGRGSFALKVVR
jgi:hypothetical protein